MSDLRVSTPSKSEGTDQSSKSNQGGLPRRTVWVNWDEWISVQQGLFSDNRHVQLQAIKKVAAWRARGKLPLSIDATSNFVEISLKDEGFQDSTHPTQNRSEIELRLMYSMALIRFVNGIVDTEQKGLYAASIHQIADKLGLPKSFVEIRHEATHGELPSLSVLRQSCKEGLQWLNDNYWNKQQVVLSDIKESLEPLLMKYKQLQTKKMKTEDSNQMTEIANNSVPILNEIIEKTPSNSVKDLAELLVDSFLIPMKRKKFKEIYKLPERLSNMWRAALKRFHTTWPHFTPTLFIRLVKKVLLDENDENSEKLSNKQKEEKVQQYMYRQSLLVCWVDFILNGKFRKKSANSQTLELPLKRVVELCLENFGSKWSQQIMAKVLGQLGASEEFLERIEQLTNIQMQSVDISTSTNQDSPEMLSPEASQEHHTNTEFELEEFENILHIKKHKGKGKSGNGPWVECISSPNGIGSIEGGNFEDLNLGSQFDSFKGPRPKRNYDEVMEEPAVVEVPKKIRQEVRVPEEPDTVEVEMQDSIPEWSSEKSISLIFPLNELIQLGQTKKAKVGVKE